MKRRGFLKMLAGTAAAVVAAPLMKLAPEVRTPSGHLIGSTVKIRMPQRYIVPFEWDAYEKLVLSEHELKEKYIRPAIKGMFDMPPHLAEAYQRGIVGRVVSGPKLIQDAEI